MRDLITQVNMLSRKVEDLADENTVLRKKAGVGEQDKVDTRDVRQQKEATIAQLRSLNALLERQVADLEEERRKLRMELKFRAKYHGQHALEMGLTPEQLLLVEELVDDIKNGRNQEARLVDQLTHRVRRRRLLALAGARGACALDRGSRRASACLSGCHACACGAGWPCRSSSLRCAWVR